MVIFGLHLSEWLYWDVSEQTISSEKCLEHVTTTLDVPLNDNVEVFDIVRSLNWVSKSVVSATELASF